MIEAVDLTKTYGERDAIRDVTFNAEPGEILGFLGPNGAGKTTTMRILTGYTPATSGMARVAGYDVFTQSLQAREKIGYLPEMVPLYPEMTVASYLDFVCRLRKVNNRRERIAEAMADVDVTDRADDIIGKLSRGYRQRVGLAQAIVHNPSVLILDEPTSGLDPRQRIEVRDLVKRMRGNRTVVFSTHILSEVADLCDRVLIINEGRIVAEDTPANLTQRMQGGERLLVRVGGADGQVPTALGTVAGVLNVQSREDQLYEITVSPGADRRAEIARLIVTRGWDLLELRPVGMSLEEVFVRLTSETDEATEAEAEPSMDGAEQLSAEKV